MGLVVERNRHLSTLDFVAESVLKTLDSDTDSVMPANVVREKFIHFSADNIGILDETVGCKTLLMQLKLQHGK